LFVEEFFLGEEFGVAGHASVYGMSAGVLWFGLVRTVLGTRNTLREDGRSDGQTVFRFDQKAIR
jgi:hypothetical protein